MTLWIPITLFAALIQALRFGLQKHLATAELSAGGATFARFFYALPFAAVALSLFFGASDAALPRISPGFWAFALAGAASQILATIAVVALFKFRNFTIGITLKKTEVLQTALIGIVILGEGLSLPGWAAVFVGIIGVLILSKPPELNGKVFNAATALGLLSGFLFGISAVTYRGATQMVLADDPILRAAVTLTAVLAIQTVMMVIGLRLLEPGQIGRVLCAWRVAIWVGVTSLLGSFAWFSAFAMQNAAYVKALGQVELIFTFLISTFYFRETTVPREYLGILLLVLSVLLLIIFA